MGHEFVDWTLFGLFMYALFALLPRRRRERWRRRSLLGPPPTYVPPPPPPAPGVATPPAPRLDEPAVRLPADVQAQVEQIRRKVELLLQHASNLPAGSEDRYILQRTLDDYLPATVDAYLALPAGAIEATAPDGRTPLQVLKDQLDLLDAKVDEIGEDLQRRNLDSLLANGRFLEERFGRPDSGANP
jgi:hypothetical protein